MEHPDGEPGAKAASACGCPSLSDPAGLDAGHEEHVFASLDKVRMRDAPYPWVSAWKCRQCGQAWLVGTDWLHNDIYCMHRISDPELSDIVRRDRWPSAFDRFETLLEIGRAANRSVRYVDPIGDSDLHVVMTDLARARPGILLSELASLLNLDSEVARQIADDVMRESGVVIDVREQRDKPTPK